MSLSDAKLCKSTRRTLQSCESKGVRRHIGGPRQIENTWRATLRNSLESSKTFDTRAPESKEDAAVERRRAASSLAAFWKSARIEQAKSVKIERRMGYNVTHRETDANLKQILQMRDQRADELAWRHENALECRRRRKCRDNSALCGRVDACNRNASATVDEVVKAVHDELQASKARLAKLRALQPSCRGRDHLPQHLHDVGTRLLAWQAMDPKLFEEVLSQEALSKWLHEEIENSNDTQDGCHIRQNCTSARGAMLEEADIAAVAAGIGDPEEEEFMAWLVGQGDASWKEGQRNPAVSSKHSRSPYCRSRGALLSFAPPPRA